MKKLLEWVLSALYGLVMMEVIIMVSPFAFYWYALYAPALQGLNRWRATAWLEAFFLPHAVITTSPVLEFLRWQMGAYCFSLGILGFLFCAAQVYGAKLFRGGVVHSWIYSHIRHPQYLFLSIAGFGLLTMWPRIIILVFYTGMLFIYYFLARFEERQMEAKFPDYAAYRQRTAMFIPGNPGGKLFHALFGWITSRPAALAAMGGAVAVLVIAGALSVRHYVINHSATEFLPEDRTLAISIWPMESGKIEAVVSAALRDEQVRSALGKEPGAVFTAHILPADYSMVDMFADVEPTHHMFGGMDWGFFKHLGGLVFPFLRSHHRNRLMGTPQEDFQVIFSRVDGPSRQPVPVSEIASLESKMTPVVIADVGGEGPTVQNVVIPPRQSLWGNITMPMF